MTARPLRIGITCYPLIGGSGILATALGSDLARRGNEVHFFSSAKPVRLDLSQPGIFFHEVVVNEYSLFKYPDYTLPLAVKMAGIGRARQLDIFHVHYAVPHATAAWLAVQMLGGPGPGVPRIVTARIRTTATPSNTRLPNPMPSPLSRKTSARRRSVLSVSIALSKWFRTFLFPPSTFAAARKSERSWAWRTAISSSSTRRTCVR